MFVSHATCTSNTFDLAVYPCKPDRTDSQSVTVGLGNQTELFGLILKEERELVRAQIFSINLAENVQKIDQINNGNKKLIPVTFSFDFSGPMSRQTKK